MAKNTVVPVHAQYSNRFLGFKTMEVFRQEELTSAIYTPSALHDECVACEDLDTCPLGDECALYKTKEA